jgi:hypothetical protein
MPTIDLPDDELNASAAKHVLVCASIWFTRFLPCRERRNASRVNHHVSLTRSPPAERNPPLGVSFIGNVLHLLGFGP